MDESIENFIDAMALVVSDSFISPAIFSTVCSQVSQENNISEADVSAVMMACYGWHLWKDESLKDFLKDYIDTVFEEASSGH